MDRLYAVDALRAFCIILVMGFHFFTPGTGHWGTSDPVLRSLEPLFRNGGWGVTGFFVVSGFLITRLLMRGGTRPTLPLREFYIRRAARLLPLLVVFVGLGWAAHAWDPSHARVLFGERPETYPSGFWISVLFFAYNWYAVFQTGPDSLGLHWRLLWSLAVEEQFYLVFPAAARKWAEPPKILAGLFVVAVLGVLFRAWTVFALPPGRDWLRLTPALFDPLALGAASYLVWMKVRPQLDRAPLVALFLAACGGAIIVRSISVFDHRPWLEVFTPAVLSLGCSLFLVGACSLPDRWARVLTPFAWVGSLSYGLYLLHVGVYFFIAPVLVKIPSADGGALLYFTVAFTVAWACHRFYEVPANRSIRLLGGIDRPDPSHPGRSTLGGS